MEYIKKYHGDVPRPPKLMDCKKWSTIMIKANNEIIKDLKDPNNPKSHRINYTALINKVERVSKEMSKDDYFFCGKSTHLSLDTDGTVFSKACFGVRDMKSPHFPKNSCKKHDWKEVAGAVREVFGEILTKQRSKGGSEVGETCTCSNDGCNGGSYQAFNNYLAIIVLVVFINFNN